MSAPPTEMHELPPTAEAIFNKLSRFLSGFGRTAPSSTLVIVRTHADDAIPELRLAMFLRDEAEARSVKASRMIGQGGARAAAAQMSAPLSARETPSPSPLGADPHVGLSVVVATRNASDVIRAATDFGLTAQRMARWDTRRILGHAQARRRRVRHKAWVWPSRDRRNPSPS